MLLFSVELSLIIFDMAYAPMLVFPAKGVAENKTETNKEANEK